MENLKEQIENNMNANGGGLAVNITGRYESNRHAIAKMEQYTFGEVVAFLKKKKNGGFEISSKELLSAYFEAVGEPEWHHAGFLPKSYGGGMKKTYFLEEIPTILEVKKILKKASKKRVKIIVKRHLDCILADKKRDFRNLHAKRFIRLSSAPSFSVELFYEMNGKFGWFESNSMYKLDEYVSGWNFESEEKMNEYLSIK